jgi:hypothetical protein
MTDKTLANRLLAKIKAHDALAGIIGMGYVGLPPVILSMGTARWADAAGEKPGASEGGYSVAPNGDLSNLPHLI